MQGDTSVGTGFARVNLDALRRGWWIGVLAFCGTLLAAYRFTSLQTPVYRSTMKIVVGPDPGIADTQEILLEFGPSRCISWFGRSCSTYGDPGYKANGIIFHGNKGTIDYDGGGKYTVYDLANKPVKTVGGVDSTKVNLANSADPGLDDTHAQNFIEAIRGNASLTAPIEEGHCSTVLGQLGNIAHRVGRSVKTDPANGRILGDPEAAKLWTRDYAPGWEPTV